ncbi:hypothetical protein [Agarilytica rhodophyticola]
MSADIFPQLQTNVVFYS